MSLGLAERAPALISFFMLIVASYKAVAVLEGPLYFGFCFP